MERNAMVYIFSRVLYLFIKGKGGASGSEPPLSRKAKKKKQFMVLDCVLKVLGEGKNWNAEK